VKFPYHGKWQRQDAYITQKRQRTIHSTADRLIFASTTWDGLIVVECDGRAHCEIDNPGRNSPCDSVCHVCVGKILELWVREEPDVEEENGQFDADQSGLVYSLKCKRYLESID
jgi:hypothetical protein